MFRKFLIIVLILLNKYGSNGLVFACVMRRSAFRIVVNLLEFSADIRFNRKCIPCNKQGYEGESGNHALYGLRGDIAAL